jgi:hypothetical protein
MLLCTQSLQVGEVEVGGKQGREYVSASPACSGCYERPVW